MDGLMERVDGGWEMGVCWGIGVGGLGGVDWSVGPLVCGGCGVEVGENGNGRLARGDLSLLVLTYHHFCFY